MALFLAQHGASLSKDEDPEKGLSAVGRADTQRIAEVGAAYKIPVAGIVHSGKARARQTAQIFEALLNPGAPTRAIKGIAPLDDVAAFAETVAPGDNLLVVGHLPFMGKLVSLLTCGRSEALVYQFQNSGIICLDTQGNGAPGSWYIKWSLNPRVD